MSTEHTTPGMEGYRRIHRLTPLLRVWAEQRERQTRPGDDGLQLHQGQLQRRTRVRGDVRQSPSSYSPGGFQLGSTSEYRVAVCPNGPVACCGAPGAGKLPPRPAGPGNAGGG